MPSTAAGPPRPPPTRRNLAAAYVGLAINGAVSFILIAWLARTLGPQAWSAVLLAHAFGFWAAMIPEFGFGLSATRNIARRQHRRLTPDAAYSVLAGKALLSVGLVPLFLLLYLFVPQFRADELLLFGTFCFALAQGLDMDWLFGGLERQYVYSAIASFGRLLTLVLVVLFVREPADAWLTMFFYSAGSAAIALLGVLYLRLCLGAPVWKSRHIKATLRSSRYMFKLRVVQSLSGRSSLVVLGFVAPAAVAAFGAADRIVRGLLALLGPLGWVALARMASLSRTDGKAADRWARTVLVATLLCAIAASGAVAVAAPLVIELLLGAGYEAVVPVLRVLAVAVPIWAASTMLMAQWLLPQGLDTIVTRIAIFGGVANVLGCSILGAFWGAAGAAFALVAAEALILAASVAAAARAQGGFFGVRGGVAPADDGPASPAAANKVPEPFP